jgi:adenylate cyclase class IV
MIEVESKFTTERENLAQLLSKAERLKAGEIIDEFADTQNFDLVRNKLRLRRRNGQWQLKVGVKNNLTAEGIKSYQEVEGEELVEEALQNLLGQGLRKMEIFAEIHKFREKFLLQGFGIDLDRANYKFSEYQVNEVELMVESEAEKPLAEAKIREFAAENNLILGDVRGTLMEYLYRHQNQLYQHLKRLKKEANSGKF